MVCEAHEARYRLARGTQVREEDFGLLFYTLAGPRLYFLSSGPRVRTDLFEGREGLMAHLDRSGPIPEEVARAIGGALRDLAGKGVLHEC